MENNPPCGHQHLIAHHQPHSVEFSNKAKQDFIINFMIENITRQP
jgi:hypothetical protein